MGHRHHARSRRLHRDADQRIPRNSQCRGPAPYIQHRGGPPGFLRVLDERTIAFVDYAGNRQYITSGNLCLDNPKAFLFLIDYAHRRRIKIWGTARVIEGDEALLGQLMRRTTRPGPNRWCCSPFQPGTPIARSIFPSASKPLTLPLPSPDVTRALPSLRPRSAS